MTSALETKAKALLVAIAETEDLDTMSQNIPNYKWMIKNNVHKAKAEERMKNLIENGSIAAAKAYLETITEAESDSLNIFRRTKK